MQKQLLLSLFICWFTVLTAQEEKSLAVGRTAGELAVSSTGAATYMVPLVLPPGIKEVVPALALSYNSQGGNGVAGWGWNIAGLSTISRIGATLHHDGRIDPVDFDQHDRFALDGQRLILVEGEEYGADQSVYATENYSNIKVVANSYKNGEGVWTPSGFSVYYPDGSRAYYWKSGGLEWAISRWEDPQGNTILYTYKTDGGTLLIDKIYYGARSSSPASHPNVISFKYEDKNLFSFSYIGGRNYRQLKYLTAIEITTGEHIYRDYQLTHDLNSGGYERLTGIEEQTVEEKKSLISFNYDNPKNEIISVENTFQTFENEEDVDFDIRYHRTLSGDFDGDGILDYLKYHKNRPDFTFYFDNSKMAYRFHARNSDAIVSGREMIGFGLSQWQNENNHIATAQGLTIVTEKKELREGDKYQNLSCDDIYRYQSELYFSTYKINEAGSLEVYEKKWDNSLLYNKSECEDSEFTPEFKESLDCDPYQIRTIPKETISGDFNGDGITDLLLFQRPYSYERCFGNSVSIYQNRSSSVYWVDLDRKKTTDFVSFAGSLNFTLKEDDQLLVGDYNGNGVSDLWVFNATGGLHIYELNQNNHLEEIASMGRLNGSELKLPLLLGDFNGDGKTDFMVAKLSSENPVQSSTPRGSGTSNTSVAIDLEDRYVFHVHLALGGSVIGGGRGTKTHFYVKEVSGLSFQPKELRVAGNTDQLYQELQFQCFDADGDGRANIIRHKTKIEFAQYSQNRIINEDITLYELTFASSATTVSVNQKARNSFFHQLTRDLSTGVPIRLDYNQQSLSNQFSYLIGKRIYQKEFSYHHGTASRLNQISHKGMTQSIAYTPLNSQNDVYSADHSQIYPYVNINNAPNLYLVEKVTATANGQTATQKFKYKGAVSHAGGLGFLGFMATGRTNSYGTNVRALWSVSQHDPQKRGAVTQSWTSIYNHLYLPNQTSQYSSYEYSTSTTEKGVFINLPTAISTEDHLMGFETLQTYTYDAYYNPSRILTERFSGNSRQGSTDQNYTYSNSSTPTNAKYHIGRLKSEVRIERWGDRSHTTTTQYTEYDNNLLKSMKLQGDATEWLTETMTYDAYGNLLSKVLSADGESDRSQSFTYTPDGRFLASSTDIEDLTTSFLYYNDGSLKSETDPFTKTTTYTYDAWQRLQSVTDYLSNTSSTTYYWDHVDLVERHDGADGSASLRVIDPWGRERFKGQLLLNGWRYTETKYDVAGRVVMQTEPYRKNPATVVFRAGPYRDNAHTHSLRNSTQYDAYGRVSAQGLATGKSISTTYSRGNPTTVVNDGYQEVSTTLDARGKIAQLTDPNGTIVYTYHPTGELLESNYDGHVVNVTYDGWGRKKTLSDPSAGSFSYTYDIFGQLTQEVSPWGTTDYRYDAQGKLDWKEQKGDNTNLYTDYSYDPTTQLLTREDTTDRWNGDSFVKTIAYDEHERPETLTESNDWASFSQTLSYDPLGRIAQEQRNATATGATQQSVAITHRYAANGQLDALLANQKKVWELKAENARGQATQVQLGNGITKINAFDALGFLNSTTHGAVFSLSLNYNKAKGVLNSRTQKGHAKEVFTHDSRNRLTQVLQDSLQRKYSYDTYGRMAENSRVGEYHYTNPNDRYVLDSLFLNAHGKKFYEEHPRQTAKYNIDRKATQVHQEGHGIANFIYNSSGQRVHAFYGNEEEDWSERKYRKHYSTLFPAEITVNQETEEAKTLMYLGGDAYTAPVVLINSQDHYLHRDHLGSILAISNAAGKAVEERHFTPWGEVDYFAKNGIVQEKFEDSILPRGFTGHEHFEQVTLIHMNGRMYDPQLRRFIAPDNHIQDPFDTRSYDRKAYVWNNPLMASDPSGEIIATVITIIKIISYISTAINAINAIANGASFGQVLFGIGVGILLGQIGGAIGGSASGLLSSSATAFAKGFVGGFIGGFVSGTLGAVINGASIGDALKTGLISGAVAGVLAGLANTAAGAKVQGQQQGSATADRSNLALRQRLEEAIPNAELQGVSTQELAHNTQEAWGAKSLTLGELNNIRAIEANGININPKGFTLSNASLRNSVKSLYLELENELGYGNFEFQVSGGDRYHSNGGNYSTTNHKLITSGKSTAHNIERGARAVDLRIRNLNGKTFDHRVIQHTLERINSPLFYDLNALPSIYGDGHHHLQLPKGY